MGLAWLFHGLGARSDVAVVSVDIDPELRAGLERVRSELLAAASLHTVELDFSSGVMLAVRRRKLQS